MGSFQRRYEGEEDEATSTSGTCAERAVIDYGASAKWTSRRGLVILRLLAALTGIRGVAAQAVLETPRDLCIQGIQAAIIDRISDLFEDIYLPNRHQVCLCLHANMLWLACTRRCCWSGARVVQIEGALCYCNKLLSRR